VFGNRILAASLVLAALSVSTTPAHAGESSFNTGADGYVAVWVDDEINGSPGTGGGCGYTLWNDWTGGVINQDPDFFVGVMSGGASAKSSASFLSLSCTVINRTGETVAQMRSDGSVVTVNGAITSATGYPFTLCADLFAFTEGRFYFASGCAFGDG